ncbi:MAG: hypothetical protein A4E65_02389 [Syntrophorhabdus sp. PtaU1.Bin153]|nr:MAG: hypothetical protein A4E65_02389 [Syntrophorhabdus sp. PtaU1.Bin153]
MNIYVRRWLLPAFSFLFFQPLLFAQDDAIRVVKPDGTAIAMTQKEWNQCGGSGDLERCVTNLRKRPSVSVRPKTLLITNNPGAIHPDNSYTAVIEIAGPHPSAVPNMSPVEYQRKIGRDRETYEKTKMTQDLIDRAVKATYARAANRRSQGGRGPKGDTLGPDEVKNLIDAAAVLSGQKPSKRRNEDDEYIPIVKRKSDEEFAPVIVQKHNDEPPRFTAPSSTGGAMWSTPGGAVGSDGTFYKDSGSGMINTQTGDYYHRSGSGFTNGRGEYIHGVGQ